MKKEAFISTQIILLTTLLTVSEAQQLKSLDYGLKMMLSDVPKEQLIGDIRFEQGPDDNVDVIRLDHVGPNLWPLIISSKMPMPTDSLGILSFSLQTDSLRKLLTIVDNVNPKIYSRKVDYVLVRVTYRIDGRLEQYHVTNARIVIGFLRFFEDHLKLYDDTKALNIFYLFTARMNLHKLENGKRVWKYYD